MRVLKVTLQVCTFAGCWQPDSRTSLFKHIIYKAYAMFLLSALYLFAFSQFMNLILNVENSDEFTDSLYMMLTVFIAGCKQVYMWIKRKNFMMIINVFNKKPFAVCESHELMIQQKFEKIAQNITLRYLTLIMVTVTSIVFVSIFTIFTNRELTYKAWVPFNYSIPVLYVLVYAHQLIGMGTSGFVNVACDSVLCGLLLHICSQLEILEYRFTKMMHCEDILRDCVCHHNYIFEYAHTVNNLFTKVIGMQFSVSLLVICSNLYRISMAPDFATFITVMLYTGCILAQIFIYCWFGNEVKIKSLQLMNNIEWSALSNNSKKGLLIIMKRSMIPIEFTSAHLITINLESFVALLKMSYSVFNLLRQTQE